MIHAPISRKPRWIAQVDNLRDLAPGVSLAVAVAVAAVLAAPRLALSFPVPATVIALFIGIALSGIAARGKTQPGLAFCVKKLLRWAVALLGLRVAFGDILSLGISTAMIVVGAMLLTLAAGFLLARYSRQTAAYGAIAGVATAVCGASAALAASTVVPNYAGKETDVVFVVVAVNALSTVAMVVYPPLGAWLGFDAVTTGTMLGATIHDVAQVVGAGYSVSETAGNTAVIVKLFRVFLLLPVVLSIAWWFRRNGASSGAASVPVPVFAIGFLALCVVNSWVPTQPGLASIYAPAKAYLVEASNWGLLIAIAALGLGTSPAAVAKIGWRPAIIVTGTTLVILVAATAGLALVSTS